MFTKSTVLILGAGASMSYGFPSAVDLLVTVANHFRGKDPKRPAEQSLQHFTTQTFIDFANVLESSGHSSIDAFLEHQPRYVPIGKTCIAFHLLQAERKHHRNLKSRGESWYHTLWEKLNTGSDEFGNNQLSVITFNYDLTLEQFLFDSLKNSYDLSDDEAAEQLRTVPIIHVHGQLGHLNWQSPDNNIRTRSYGSGDDNQQTARAAADSIKIITETDEKTPEFLEAQNLINSATKIFFIGFGYHEPNMQRLKIPTMSSDRVFYENKFIGGTCFGFTAPEKKHFLDRYGHLFFLGEPGHNAYWYLRNSTEFMSA